MCGANADLELMFILVREVFFCGEYCCFLPYKLFRNCNIGDEVVHSSQLNKCCVFPQSNCDLQTNHINV